MFFIDSGFGSATNSSEINSLAVKLSEQTIGTDPQTIPSIIVKPSPSALDGSNTILLLLYNSLNLSSLTTPMYLPNFGSSIPQIINSFSLFKIFKASYASFILFTGSLALPTYKNSFSFLVSELYSTSLIGL